MIEFFGYQINSVIDISILITLAGIIIYYFGKLISDTQPQRQDSDKATNYVHGFGFVFFYIVLPLALIYSIYRKDLYLSTLSALLLILQYVISIFLNRKWIALYDISDFKDIKYHADKRMKEVSEQIITKYQLNKFIKNINIIGSVYKIWYSKFKSTSAFIFSIITIGSSVYLISQEIGLIYKLASVFMTFLSLSIIAILLHIKPRSEVEIIFDNNKSVRGKLNKIEDGYITIFVDNFVYNINKDKIKMIKRIRYDKSKFSTK